MTVWERFGSPDLKWGWENGSEKVCNSKKPQFGPVWPSNWFPVESVLIFGRSAALWKSKRSQWMQENPVWSFNWVNWTWSFLHLYVWKIQKESDERFKSEMAWSLSLDQFCPPAGQTGPTGYQQRQKLQFGPVGTRFRNPGLKVEAEIFHCGAVMLKKHKTRNGSDNQRLKDRDSGSGASTSKDQTKRDSVLWCHVLKNKTRTSVSFDQSIII